MPSFISHVFKDKELSDISTKIDNLVSSIPVPEDIPPVEGITSKFIDEVLLKDDDKKDGKGGLGNTLEQDKLFENVSVPAERLARYAVYKEINRSVPIIKRIIKVYTSHLLQKNPVDGRCIIYRESSKLSQEDEDKTKEAKKFAESVETHFDLPRKLKDNICPKKLLYGNCFVEIVDVRKEAEKIDLTKVNLLQEAESLEKRVKNTNGNISGTTMDLVVDQISKMVHEVFDNSETNLTELDDTSRGKISEEHQDEETAKSIEKDITNPFLDVVMKVHHPERIIILQSKYGTRLGYLEVHKDSQSTDYQSVSQSISNVVGKITTLTKTSASEQSVIDKIIHNILKQTLSKSSNFDSNKIESALKSLGEDVYIFIKRLFIEQDIGNKTKFNKIRTRFIPINRMVDFTVPSNDYIPYGESVVDPLILPCKLYMLAQLSNVIIKLSRAAVVRKWIIDTGSTQMQSGLIQKLKRELYNTRVSLDDLSSFKSIPKILSDFKDMFIFTKQGQRSLDVEVQNLGDPSIKVADLEDARREIIALSGIPAPYLGYMDVVELREQLVHSNVTFATEISDMQENDNESLTKLIDIIADVKQIGYKPSKYVKVSLIPPVVLIVQLIEMTLSSIGNIAGVFTNLQLPIDPYFFLEKYVPHIDWDKFKEAAQKDSIESKTRTELGSGANQGPGGGMF